MFFFECIFWIFLLVFPFLLQNKKKYCSAGGGGLRPNAPCAPGPAPYLDTSSLFPYIPGYRGLAGVVSRLRAYTRYVELYIQNCIK